MSSHNKCNILHVPLDPALPINLCLSSRTPFEAPSSFISISPIIFLVAKSIVIIYSSPIKYTMCQFFPNTRYEYHFEWCRTHA